MPKDLTTTVEAEARHEPKLNEASAAVTAAQEALDAARENLKAAARAAGEDGCRKVWIADKLGMTTVHLGRMLSGRRADRD